MIINEDRVTLTELVDKVLAGGYYLERQGSKTLKRLVLVRRKI